MHNISNGILDSVVTKIHIHFCIRDNQSTKHIGTQQLQLSIKIYHEITDYLSVH